MLYGIIRVSFHVVSSQLWQCSQATPPPPPQVDALQFISLYVPTGSQRTTFTIFLSGHNLNTLVLLLQTLGVNWQHVIVGLLSVITETCGF